MITIHKQLKQGTKAIESKDIAKFYRSGGKLEDLLISIKHNGVRLHLFINESSALPLSFNKKPLDNCACFAEEARYLYNRIKTATGKKEIMLDGEAIDKSGRFKKIMEQLHRIENVDMSNAKYAVFDFWYPGIDLTLEQRLDVMGGLSGTERVFPVDHYPFEGRTEEDLKAVATKCINAGLEGIVAKRRMLKYEERRSPGWIKFVDKLTLDLAVVDFEEGKGKLAGHVGKFICSLGGGKTVKVSPGKATHEELKNWFTGLTDRPRIVQVAFKAWTEGGSLQHPVFECERKDKDIPDL